MWINILRIKIKNIVPNTKYTKLTYMCDTQWTKNYDGI